MKQLAPVVMFVYARPKHTRQTIEALSKNNLAKETEVYIYADNTKKQSNIKDVEEVRKYIDTIPKKRYFKSTTIIKSEANKGLAKSVIEGVTEIINKYDKVIVVEDDLVTSKFFLEYMNNALDFYESNKAIWSISGYTPPIDIPREYKHDIYLGYRASSWGWATWKDRWNTIDWKVKDYPKFKHNIIKRKKLNRGGPDMAQMLDSQMKKRIDSWAIRWCYEQSKQDKLTIFPTKSLVINRGLDGSGTHSGKSHDFDVILTDKLPKLEKDLIINKKITKNFYYTNYHGIKQKIVEIFTILGLEKIIDKYKSRKRKV